jgi:NAD(P)-dependent dehydrogenase (short-subunit alcohol dehydrogenase family)
MLESKVGLVTGAAQGIGRAIAVEMARQGAVAVAVADRDVSGAEETAALVREAGAEAEAIEVDLRKSEQIEAMVEHVVESFGGLDALFNNAGLIETSLTDQTDLVTLSEEAWNTVHEVNLKAVWLTTKFAAPHLKRSVRGPAIVNTASVSGLTGFAHAPAYGSSKAAVIQLTRNTAVELVPIRCNCFAPGVIETPLSRAFMERAGDPVALERAMVAPQLIKRMGKPEEVAKLACFLASDDAAFITGAVFPIDGGALAWMGIQHD